MHRALAFFVAFTVPLSGCLGLFDNEPVDLVVDSYADLGFDGDTWPPIAGGKLTVLSHGAFPAFDEAARLFKNLTGVHVTHITADDAGSALNLAIREKGDPTFDVIYGVDNILMGRAIEEGIFAPYTPRLASRIAPDLVFFPVAKNQAWPATPVDHGYIGINWDPNHDGMPESGIAKLSEVRDHATLFVTQDPRTSTPGMGFLLATIATFGEEGEYTWEQYWMDLLENGVLVTAGWTEAYENHFSAGYGADYGGLADRPIVTSYTTSPAYEAFFGRAADQLAKSLTAPLSTFLQIETMGIIDGAPNRVAAEAWIEFTLTDAFQELIAPNMAVYPVVPTVDVTATFGDLDPTPGTFETAEFSYLELATGLPGWIEKWVALCEAKRCA